MTDHRARNDASRARLETIAAGVAAGTHRVNVGEWTPSTLLAHLAFWDRLTLQRWNASIRDGRSTPADLPDGLQDLINDASAPAWSALSPTNAASEAVAAAREVDAFLATLDDALAAQLEVEGRPRLVDRSRHRADHLDAIEAATRGGASG
jgi:DinB family protein